jgi:hypothetical protein
MYSKLNKFLSIILCGILALSCAENSSLSKENIPAPTQTPSPPYSFNGSAFNSNNVAPSKPTIRDRGFPTQIRDVLEKAERIQLFETEVCTPGKGETLTPKVKGRLQDCKVLREGDVTEPEERKRLVDEIRVAIETGAASACFDPRHGVRAEHNGKRVELLICFECNNYRGASEEDSFAGAFSSSAEELFKQILAKKKVVKK